jgi:hypothetical protein
MFKCIFEYTEKSNNNGETNMKIKISLMFVLLLGYAWVAADSIPVTNSSFELPGTGKIKGWNGENGADIPGWASSTAAVDSGVETEASPTDGTFSAFFMNSDPSAWNLTDKVIVSGEEYTLQVDSKLTGGPVTNLPAIKLTLYYDNAGTRTEAVTQTFDMSTTGSSWLTYSISFKSDDVPAGIGKKIGIEIKNAGVTNNTWIGVDNVRLDMATLFVANVAPAGGSTNVAIDANLEWTVVNGWDVDVYLSGPYADPNNNPVLAQVISDQAVTSYNPAADLLNNRWYYWRVDAREPNGLGSDIIHPGPTWSFKTVQAEASISAVSPAYTAVDAGGVAVLSVTGTAVTSYQWYKIGSPDVQLTDSGKYSGVTTNTLTISNVQSDEEGYYYCTGSNNLPSLASNRDTGSGHVMTKRLTSYYPFEVINVVDGNSVTPDVVGGFDAVLKQESASAGWPTLNDANALIGTYCMQFDNADHATDPNGQYAQIPAGVADYEDITISAWVHPKGGSEWQRIFDFGNGMPNHMFLTPDAGGSPGLRFATRINSGAEQQLNASWLAPNSWYFVAVTITGDTGCLYRNGELVNTNTGMTINPINLGAVFNYIGKSQYPDPEFNGLIDDLKIYNYAKTTVEIAQDYTAIMGGWVCNRQLTALTYDLDGNCQVDLADFALLAAKWLDSNRIVAP